MVIQINLILHHKKYKYESLEKKKKNICCSICTKSLLVLCLDKRTLCNFFKFHSKKSNGYACVVLLILHKYIILIT